MLVAFQDPLLDTADPAFMHLFQITERLGMLATGMPGEVTDPLCVRTQSVLISCVLILCTQFDPTGD